ncbi:MAG TPA: glycoside hydrolase family 15 protein [Pyrinomonadaceae bacterium]|nr:glycoside hydrolase family 15 protein [Pyrinomonadaceae bacterium]
MREGYRPIRDYALIGDAHTAALVSSDGSIDWLCWPRFDGPAVFCRLLDKDKGGYFRVGPAGRRAASTRAYVEGTNVLTTVFSTDRGRFRLTDLMPVERLNVSHEGEDIASHYRVIRLIEGLSGEAEVEVCFRPTFDYARARAAFDFFDGGVVARNADETLRLACPAKFSESPAGGVTARFTVSAGQRLWVTLTYFAGRGEAGDGGPDYDPDVEREQTLDYWREWSFKTCTYSGPYAKLVRRSALALKLLTYEPTGALVAAPTTSLPEELGGVRNWDYRYTWLRDSSLIIYALQLIGYHEEATDFFQWLDRLCIPCGNELQIMYRIDGSSDLPEVTLEHLEGYRGSRPVRVGNAAFGQKQLDIYGEVIDAAYLYHERTRQSVRPELWDTLRYMADQAVARWREPDQGIWEVRGGPRHFLYSKLLCWVALDRITRLASRDRLPGDADVWASARDEIRSAILTEGYDQRLGAFTQAFGDEALDACALVIPQFGFLPPTDPRVVSTVKRIQERLTSHGLVYRYLSDDGLPGGEATFTLCSYWLVDCLAEAGRVDEARELFERIAAYANDLGLLAEEIDPVSGELLGNYPQGFTHLGLIRSALHIAKAEALGPEEKAETPAERAGRMEGAGQVPDPSKARRRGEG